MSNADTSVGSGDVTVLLSRWAAGDRDAFDQAVAVIYPELHRIAVSYLRRERDDHTLQPTGLVNEAFLRMMESGSLRFESRKHFYALSAQLMRRVLVDHARSVTALKRGGGARKITLDTLGDFRYEFADEFLILHEALSELEKLSPRKVQVIELRHFGGLTLDETAEILGISAPTVHRELRLAEAWLAERLAG